MRGKATDRQQTGKPHGQAPITRHTRLLILGAGKHGRCVAEAARSMGYESIAFLDDKKYVTRFEPVTGLPIIGGWNAYQKLKGCYDYAVVAIGNNILRREWQEWLSEAGYCFRPIIHERTEVSTHAKIGAGTTIMADAVISAGAQIGEGCIINTGAAIGHDCAVGRFTQISISARIENGVRIGDCARVCMGAHIADGIKIGANAIVATGAAVMNDVAPGSLVAGVPAQVKKASHFNISALA